MIQKVEMYTVVCDNCGEDAGADSEHSCWNDKEYAEQEAMESDWLEEGRDIIVRSAIAMMMTTNW